MQLHFWFIINIFSRFNFLLQKIIIRIHPQFGLFLLQPNSQYTLSPDLIFSQSFQFVQLSFLQKTAKMINY